jgi:hypothetical protein
LVVTPTSDPDVLISSILGPGITVLPVPAPSYTGVTNQSGTFTGGTDAGVGLGIASGAILTSGNALLAPGPNNNDAAGVATGGAGDADLGGTTFNAAVLEFTFQFGDGSTGGDLFFQYAFASDEYNEFVNSSFNDAFALFVDGVNVAVAPDGQAVAINNVNCGNPYNAAQVTDNCAFFNNNDPTNGVPPYNIQYDGFTDVFLAQALGLDAGTHTMKFVIADRGDQVLDSAIFIAGGSFSPEPPNGIPEPGTLALVGGGLLGWALARRRRTARK